MLNLKKLASILLLLLIAITVVSCQTTKFTVKFDTDGGSAIDDQVVEKGKFATLPTTNPTKDNFKFSVWSTEKGNSEKEFKFEDTAITADITLYAVWTENDKSTVSFSTKGGTAVNSVIVYTGDKVTTSVANPTKEDFKFIGWYKTSYGGTWRDPESVDLTNFVVQDDVTFHAYWEPINSKTVSYTSGETYKSALSNDTAHINPLTYEDSLQSSFISNLSGSFYSEEVDWDKAIENGLASFEGDFSKFVDKNGNGGPNLTSALEPKLVLEMAAAWPVNGDGESFEDEDGNLDIELAKTIKSDVWTFKMKSGLKFENGDPVNADVYEYTLKQYLDPVQKNTRANSVYDSSYLNLLNSKNYFDGKAKWSEVGFEKVDDLTFTLTHATEISLKQAVDMVDLVTLINKTAFEASESNGKYSYGTPSHPFVSYGPYVIKEWSEKAKWVFNKNYDYIGKQDVMYKSLEYQIVSEESVREQMFSKGQLNAFGLSATYFAKYADDASALSSPDAYTMGLSFNNNKRGDKKQVASIVADHDFRMAFFYAIDRTDFAKKAAAPDVPSLGLLSDLHLSSLDDLTPYNKTEYHANAIKDFSPETIGYLPNKAKELFNKAYDKWINEGNTGPVKLEFVSRKGSTYYEMSAAYLKDALERTFGTDKLVITLNELDKDSYSAAIKAYNYDLVFNGMGGATSLPGIFFLYAIYGQLYGPGYTFEPGFELDTMELEIDFSEFTTLIKGKMETEEELEWYTKFLNGFSYDYEGVTYDIPGVDENGIWRGDMYEFSDFSSYTIEDSVVYEGKKEVLFTAMYHLEKIFLGVMGTIPLTATASTTVYNSVQVDWADYCIYFGWGGQKYRFLTTDSDYASLVK